MSKNPKRSLKQYVYKKVSMKHQYFTPPHCTCFPPGEPVLNETDELPELGMMVQGFPVYFLVHLTNNNNMSNQIRSGVYTIYLDIILKLFLQY